MSNWHQAGLVNWRLISEVGEALVQTATVHPGRVLAILIERLTLPHQLLEELNCHTEAALSGEPLEALRLFARLELILQACPKLLGSSERTRVAAGEVIEPLPNDRQITDRVGDDDLTLSYDSVVRLSSAVTLAARDRRQTEIDAALDVIMGLAVETLWLDRLARALRRDGAAGAARALNEMQQLGAPPLTPPIMHNMDYSPPSLPGGGPRVPGGNPEEEIPGFVGSIVDRLRDRRHWDPSNLDSRPTWRDFIGQGPIKVLDRDEMRRLGCFMDMLYALRLRKPPPARPARVVWSDTITGITPPKACPGEDIVIHGHGFGPHNASIGIMLPMFDHCSALSVPPSNWTGTAITVTMPAGVVSGPVGLVDLSYVAVYNQWAGSMNAFRKRALDDAKCAARAAPNVPYIRHFGECADATPYNYLRAGMPEIRSFQVNGLKVA